MKNRILTLFVVLIAGLSQANAQAQCQAMFQANGCHQVSFFDVSYSDSMDPIIAWSYDFGDGNTSTSANPSNTYSANGLYLACLTIQTSSGCSSTFCDSISINCIGGQGSCQADFVVDDSSSFCPTFAFFDMSSSAAGISSWSYDFGDGNTSSASNPSHTYAANGTYNVCLTIIANDSCSSTICNNVVVDCLGGQGSCQANFAVDDSSSVCPTFAFYDMSTAGAGISSWSYDFGDGNTSSSANPTHTYASNGIYTVCLTIIASDSCSSTYCENVTVDCIGGQGNCQANFSVDDSLSNCPTFSFYDMSTAGAGISTLSYDFGDGNTSSSANPSHTYAANGTYTVCLTIIASDSCTSSYCQTVVVNCIAGIEENAFENIFVSPNPANSIINLNLEQAYAIQYRIVGLNGSVYAIGENPATSTHTFDIGVLSSGMYLLDVQIEGTRQIIRFIKE